MSGAGTRVGSTDNGRSHMTAVWDGPLGVRRALGRLDGEQFFAYSIWHYPADADFYALDIDAIGEYLQTAGRADRLTVEVREAEPDGGYGQYVLARAPVTGTASETIRWAEHTTQVHPEEVFTAAQAAPLFEAYFNPGAIAPHVPRRRLEFD